MVTIVGRETQECLWGTEGHLYGMRVIYEAEQNRDIYGGRKIYEGERRRDINVES